MQKPYAITFSQKYRLWTVWRRTSASIYPFVVAKKTLAEAWAEAASHPLHGKAFQS